MVPQKVLILEGNPDVKLALEEFLSEGPYEIYFATTGLDGLKIPKNRRLEVATADVQLQNANGITGLRILGPGKLELKLVVANSAAPLDLTDEAHEFDVLGKLDKARRKEEHQETPDNSANSQSYRKTWMESYLNANYSNPDLSFADLRREFRFSRSYGCRLFRQYFGKPFREKLREIRITRAERWITETPLYMKEIAAECGFSSPNRFFEAFRRLHGVSPVEYRKRNFRKDWRGASHTGDTPR